MEETATENVKTMTIQMPDETYQRIKAYLKRHKVKQKDFVIGLMEKELDDSESQPLDKPSGF